MQRIRGKLEAYLIARDDAATTPERRLDCNQQHVADAYPVLDPIASIFEVFDDAAMRGGMLKAYRFRPSENEHVRRRCLLHGKRVALAKHFNVCVPVRMAGDATG